MQSLPLAEAHERLGATFGEFAGFRMPLYYTRPIEEHHAVRSAAGVFDISHMGQFTLEGARAEDFLQHTVTGDVQALHDGQALYTLLCRPDGGVLDDLIVYRHHPARYRIIVNAGTREKDFAWLGGLSQPFGVRLADVSAAWCLLAVQGPRAFATLAAHIDQPPDRLGYYHFAETRAFGVPVFLARTGYTGEPGCELAVPSEQAADLWRELIEGLRLQPIGLAARDTLRLEACMALYDHELREAWHPFESGVGWAVKLDKAGDFVGREALRAVQRQGSAHLLAGLELTGRGIPRSGYPVRAAGGAVGEVTSGTLSPTTGKAIALAHVRAACARPGTGMFVEIRGRPVEAVVVKRPFYKSPALRG
ncbi:MAG: glycine cleavage system aminomethyltransferase GcvT [Candidatus Lambdaproteobacteria bacterium]|nr:glycine cleavage system aminomethyltransferase GcvT [Candidatus Lambdaproteobacteria bacterium]